MTLSGHWDSRNDLCRAICSFDQPGTGRFPIEWPVLIMTVAGFETRIL
jgi:hypothetical protein